MKNSVDPDQLAIWINTVFKGGYICSAGQGLENLVGSVIESLVKM